VSRYDLRAPALRQESEAEAMAAARRLSELLQEQQEPFLVETAKTRRPRRGRGGTGTGSGGGGGGAQGCCPAAACRRLLRLCSHGFKKRKSGGGSSAGVGSGLRSALSKVLCGRAVRRVLRWEDLGAAGCFSGAGAGCRREFRRLRRSLGDSGECDPRAMVFAEDDADDEDRMGWKADMMDVDSSRQLSPISVLELHSDDEAESPVHSNCKLSHSHLTFLLLPFRLIQSPVRSCEQQSFYHEHGLLYEAIFLYLCVCVVAIIKDFSLPLSCLQLCLVLF
jgi:hypothetical protein